MPKRHKNVIKFFSFENMPVMKIIGRMQSDRIVHEDHLRGLKIMFLISSTVVAGSLIFLIVAYRSLSDGFIFFVWCAISSILGVVAASLMEIRVRLDKLSEIPYEFMVECKCSDLDDGVSFCDKSIKGKWKAFEVVTPVGPGMPDTPRGNVFCFKREKDAAAFKMFHG